MSGPIKSKYLAIIMNVWDLELLFKYDGDGGQTRGSSSYPMSARVKQLSFLTLYNNYKIVIYNNLDSDVIFETNLTSRVQYSFNKGHEQAEIQPRLRRWKLLTMTS